MLVIKGKKYRVEESAGIKDLSKLPKSLKPSKITSRANKDTYNYFRELHPLSNFHPAPFVFDSFNYHCSKQFIQKKKAELFKDKSAIKRIEQATTRLKCKQDGGKISNYKKSVWEKKAKELCKPGIKQKFLENHQALTALLTDTGNKTIIECTKDTVWGCGIALHDENCLTKTKWTNQGIMGEILQEIRAELQYLVPTLHQAGAGDGSDTDSDLGDTSTNSSTDGSDDDLDSITSSGNKNAVDDTRVPNRTAMLTCKRNKLRFVVT